MVGITIAIVSFFGSRLVNQVDEMDKALQATREVQASQTEIIKGQQRDIDNNGKEIERLRNQVDRLKDDNAALKAKVGIPLTLNNKPPSGGFFVSALRSGLLGRDELHDTSTPASKSSEPDCWFSSVGRAPTL